MPIAMQTDKTKEQHYELPTSFFKLVLGDHLKYSCCYFFDKKTSLDDAEKAMLDLYCERSEIKNGHTVVDVGCGWGSLSLYIANKYCNCQVTGICNSVTQKAYIEEQCRELKLQNVEIIVVDISTFDMGGAYDRIFSIRMFEHTKNEHLANISSSEEWLKRMDLSMGLIKAIMESTYGKDSAVKWIAWMVAHFLSVAELFGYNDGEEWMVAHFLFKKK